MAKISDFGIHPAGARTQKGRRSVQDQYVPSIVQNFTPIGATVAEMSNRKKTPTSIPFHTNVCQVKTNLWALNIQHPFDTARHDMFPSGLVWAVEGSRVATDLTQLASLDQSSRKEPQLDEIDMS